MGTVIYRIVGRFGLAIALSLTVLALAACGASSESATDAPADSTDASVQTEPAGSESSESASDAVAAEPEGDVAPKFELPSGTGGSVSLASFAGDKNVVLVFYRGFW